MATVAYKLFDKMEDFFTLDTSTAGDFFPNVSFYLAPPCLFEQSNDNLLASLPEYSGTTQSPVTSRKTFTSSKVPGTATLQTQNMQEEEQLQHLLQNESNNEPEQDNSRFSVISHDEITETNESAASKNTARTTKMLMTV